MSGNQEQIIDRVAGQFRECCEAGDLPAVMALMKDAESHVSYALLSSERYEIPLYAPAYEKGHWDIIQYLLTDPALLYHIPLNPSRDNLINPMLNAACEQGNLDMVRYLLSSPDLGDHATLDSTAVHTACLSGSVPLVQYLVENYHTPENPLLDETCLQAVIINSHIPLLEYLLFDTPACQHLDIVRYLTTHDDVAFPRDLFFEDDFIEHNTSNGIHYTPAAHYLFTSPKLTRHVMLTSIAPFQSWLKDNRMNDDMMKLLNALPESVVPLYAQKIRTTLSLSLHNTSYTIPDAFVPYMKE